MAKAPRNDKGGDKGGDSGAPYEPPPRSGKNAPRSVSTHAAALSRALAGRNGFATMTVATRWREIAGDALARHTQPLSITKNASGGTLLLRAESGAALLVQHQTREILSRVNAVLGDGALTAIRIAQGAIPRPASNPKPAPPRLTPAEQEAVKQSVAGVQDDDLRSRLAALMGHSVARRRRT